MSKPLLEKLIGGRAGYEPAPKHSKISWPLGKLTMYEDRLSIRLFLMTVDLPYAQIETIKRGLFLNVVVEHCNSAEPDYVSLFGFGLMDDIERTNRRHRLGLNIG